MKLRFDDAGVGLLDSLLCMAKKTYVTVKYAYLYL